jgi:hypothetical protein
MNDIGKLDFKPGDVLRAEDLQALADAIRNPAARFVGGTNVHASQERDGSFSLSVPQRSLFLAVAGSITARSGTTLGKGPATMQANIDGTATPYALTLDVYNATPSAIAAGDYIFVEEATDGSYYAIPITGMTDGFCRLASSLGPATGTWPSITPTTQSGVTIYQSGASLGTATVYNYRNVTWATGKTTYVTLSGGIWKVVDQDC